MYQSTWTAGSHKYLANPLDPEARDVLYRMRDRLPYKREAALQPWAVLGLAIAAGASFISGIAVPEHWSVDAGMYDAAGIVGLIVFGVMAICCHVQGWVEERGVDRVTSRFHELVRSGAIVKVPVNASYDLERILKERGALAYFTNGYTATPQDYEILREIAETESQGLLNEEAQGQARILVDQIADRVTQAYEDAQADRNGRLSALRDDQPLLEEG